MDPDPRVPKTQTGTGFAEIRTGYRNKKRSNKISNCEELEVLECWRFFPEFGSPL
jgi:hypothetical protein